MKTKKWFLFLLLILTTQIGFLPVFAQTDQDLQEIKNIAEAFLKDFYRNDFDAAMSKISTRYQDIASDGTEVDYAKFKIVVKKSQDILKNYSDNSINSFQIIKTDLNNGVTIEVQYYWRRFNLGTIKEEEIERKCIFSFSKEGNDWKIVRFKHPHSIS